MDIPKRPEHKISLISLESLWEDLPVSEFIEKCRPKHLANLESLNSDIILAEAKVEMDQEPKTEMKINTED